MFEKFRLSILLVLLCLSPVPAQQDTTNVNQKGDRLPPVNVKLSAGTSFGWTFNKIYRTTRLAPGLAGGFHVSFLVARNFFNGYMNFNTGLLLASWKAVSRYKSGNYVYEDALIINRSRLYMGFECGFRSWSIEGGVYYPTTLRSGNYVRYRIYENRKKIYENRHSTVILWPMRSFFSFFYISAHYRFRPKWSVMLTFGEASWGYKISAVEIQLVYMIFN